MSHEPYDPEYIDHERESEDAMEPHDRYTILFGDDEDTEYLVERWADGRWTLSVREAFDAWSPKLEGVTVS